MPRWERDALPLGYARNSLKPFGLRVDPPTESSSSHPLGFLSLTDERHGRRQLKAKLVALSGGQLFPGRVHSAKPGQMLTAKESVVSPRERVMRIELTWYTLATCCLTSRLHPHYCKLLIVG